MTQGLQRGSLVVVAGRPSMGKTSFAMNLAKNVAKQINYQFVISVWNKVRSN